MAMVDTSKTSPKPGTDESGMTTYEKVSLAVDILSGVAALFTGGATLAARLAAKAAEEAAVLAAKKIAQKAAQETLKKATEKATKEAAVKAAKEAAEKTAGEGLEATKKADALVEKAKKVSDPAQKAEFLNDAEGIRRDVAKNNKAAADNVAAKQKELDDFNTANPNVPTVSEAQADLDRANNELQVATTNYNATRTEEEQFVDNAIAAGKLPADYRSTHQDLPTAGDIAS